MSVMFLSTKDYKLIYINCKVCDIKGEKSIKWRLKITINFNPQRLVWDMCKSTISCCHFAYVVVVGFKNLVYI